eukprot:4001403-Heterocapsa_arctica.AAC.1
MYSPDGTEQAGLKQMGSQHLVRAHYTYAQTYTRESFIRSVIDPFTLAASPAAAATVQTWLQYLVGG